MSIILKGTKEDDVLVAGNDQYTYILGFRGDDTLTAGDFGAHLNGGKGDDVLIGGAGEDRFLFKDIKADSFDTVQNFDTLHDTITIDFGEKADTWHELRQYMAPVGDDVMIEFDNTAILLLDSGRVHKDNFDFA